MLREPRGVIVTRPSPGLERTMAAVTKQGWIGLASPALKIERLHSTPPLGEPAALVVTSGQAVFSLSHFPKDVPVFAVGDRTALQVEKMGFIHVRSAHGNADDLITLLANQKAYKNKQLLLPCETTQGEYVVRKLEPENIHVVRWPVYSVAKTDQPSQDIIEHILKCEVAAILFYSTKTALSWMDNFLKNNAPYRLSSVRCVVISSRVKKEIQKLDVFNKINVASKPNHKMLMESLGFYGS